MTAKGAPRDGRPNISIRGSAGAGLRLIRGRPWTVLAWLALLTGVKGLLLAESFLELHGVRLFGAAAPRLPDAGVRTLILVLIILGTAGFWAVALAAVNRAMLRPESARFAYLRLGRDEWRQFQLVLASGVLMLAVAMPGAMAAMAFGMADASLVAQPSGRALIACVSAVLILAPVALVALRLCLAPAATFANGRVDLLGAWALTRGRFWPLAGIGLYVLVLSLLSVALVHGGLRLVFGASADLRPVFQGPVSADSFSAGRIARSLLDQAVAVLLVPLWVAPPAALLRQGFATAA